MIKSLSFKALLVGAALATCTAFSANAATINLLGQIGPQGPNPKPYDASIVRAEVDCVFCEGIDSSAVSNILGNYPTSDTFTGFVTGYSDLFAFGNSGDATELAFVNQVSLESYASGTKTDGGGASSATFSSSAEYLLLKIGLDPNVTIIRNTSGFVQEYTFTQIGQGAGLSHYTEFGSVCDKLAGVPCDPGVNEVPLPAGLPLLLAALGGIGILTRRKHIM